MPHSRAHSFKPDADGKGPIAGACREARDSQRLERNEIPAC